MQINLTLCLPRDELTIPVARHICRHALEDLGVEDDCKLGIEVALTEASANVLKHSGGDESYEIRLSVEDRICVIRVVDTGSGFDALGRGDAHANPSAESGRGIELMRALVDRVKFESKPEDGTIVHLEKELVYPPDSPMAKLLAIT
ncbi:MAG TPA: ATP-binding protein [Acidimicrobiales bacterium]|nr:ATP-binding protein [Acidimicrobiales bacterium]